MAKKGSRGFRFIEWAVRKCYPKIQVEGQENLPDEPVILVGNHSQMNGPIIGQLYIPGKHLIWCAGQMMHLKEVPKYAYEDFWAKKPKALRPFYKLLSYIIAPISVYVFNRADTIAVYRDTRIVSTFKNTVRGLQDGANIVIFPEHSQPYNHILCQFQDRFIDVAKLYYKQTGKTLCFVPMYLAPKLRKVYIGKPVRFDPAAPIQEERQRIATYLMESITQIACDLPEHKVVPYNNVPKKLYPSNKEGVYEKTGS